MKKWLGIVFLGMSLIIPQAAFAARELIDPAPVVIPAGLDTSQIVKAIKTSVLNRGWTAAKESDNQISAVLYVRQHSLNVTISYSDSEVQLTYVSSVNLDYKEKNGKRYIHRKYTGWTTSLMNEISKNLQLASMK